MPGITRVPGKALVRLLCLIVCYSLLLSSLPTAFRGGRSRSQSATPQQGEQRITGAPSPNLPNLDTIRNRKEPEPKAPAQTPAKRCRWFDLKCKQAKEKAENHSSPDRRGFGANGERLIARADRFDLLDWRRNTLADRLLSLSFENLLPNASNPQPDLPVGIRRNHLTVSSVATAAALQSITYNEIMTARADAKYRTGTGGEDLFSGNYNWSLPILSFPGRAGHGLNLTLSYNSTMWVRTGDTMVFDPDFSPISPGFRLGLPVLSHSYLNTQSNKNCYQLILPSGRVVELRQVSTGTYESGDSTYMRLTIDPSGFYILKTADGTQLKYQNLAECSEIKDRNGNLITIEYSGDGLIYRLTDTLGRMIDFNYDEFSALQSIGFKGGELIAQFSYVDKTLTTNFRDQTTNNPLSQYNFSDGLTYPALSQVYLERDGSTYTFEHSTYGQVYQIRHLPAGLERSKVVYNLPVTAAGSPAQSDCPRFTQRTDTAYEWNTVGVNTLFQIAAQGSDICGQVTTADGTIYKEIAWGAGWQRGLVKETQTLTGATLQKKTETVWEQDVSTAYQNNPRAIETKVIDVANGNKTRRTVIGYTSYNLPADVYEYDYDQTTLLRRSHTDYNFSSTYTNRRIIGLPSARMLYDGGNTLMAKMTYSYDEGSVQFLWPAVINHDNQNYGDNFIAGRGNPTSVRRYDVSDANGTTFAESQTGYYLTGAPQFTRDPLGHQTNFLYNDHFSDGLAYVPNGALRTFAYPTQIQDPDGHTWSLAYHFDWGTVTETTDPKGAKIRNDYSKSGRLNKTTNEINGAYTRYDYDPQQYFVKSYSTIQEGQGEFYSITVFDGHGRPRATISDHPGSSGQYKGVYNAYDDLGRQTQQSNPTEVDGFWIPAGDDEVNGSQGGWRYSLQTYDWQGRPLVSTNQDGSTSQASYTGCGCAGSDVTTLTDEGTLDNGVAKRRQQKIFKDIFGRVVKTQTLNWENGSPYSTTITNYNVRDQITTVKEYSGNATGTEACPSATCQKTTMDYDGHGWLSQRQLPVEDAPTVYTYAADDKPLTVEDARHAKTIYGYGAFSNPTSANKRRLLSSISYDLTNVTPSGSVPATPTVTFGYDQAGNRVWMEDEPGKIEYTYDTLSRLETEKREFDGLSGNYQFTYAYNLAGQLSSVTDNRFNTVLTYNHDKAGQLTTLTGTGFESSGQTNFTSAITPVKYRAWGGIKEIGYGNNLKSTYDYNTRLQPTSYRLLNAQSQVKDGSDYQYYPDARIKFASNLVASSPGFTVASAFDRSYSYDHTGRLTQALSGPEARGETPPAPPYPSTNLSPYKQVSAYDEWGNLTSRTNRFWRSNPNDSATYVNNRRQGTSYSYDYAGNYLSDGWIGSTYDAAGRIVRSDTLTPPVGGGMTGLPSQPSAEIIQDLDGEGRPAKRVETRRTDGLNENMQPIIKSDVTTTYYVRSSMAGGDIASELNGQGDKVKGYIHALGGRLAEQYKVAETYYVKWRHSNPVTGTLLKGNSSGSFASDDRMEYGPLGEVVGNYDPWVDDPTPTYQELKGEEPLYIEGGDPFNPRSGCGTLDGLPVHCSELARKAASGALAGQLTLGGVHIGGQRVVGSLLGGGLYSPGNVLPGTKSGATFTGLDGEVWDKLPSDIDQLPLFVRGPGRFGAGFRQTGGRQGSGQSSISNQSTQADHFGRNCPPSDMRPVKLWNETGDGFPHTFIETPNIIKGFYPGTLMALVYGRGGTADNGPNRNNLGAVSLDYKACPESMNALERAIVANLTVEYSPANIAGLNCTGWACLMLQKAGFDLPISPYTPFLTPYDILRDVDYERKGLIPFKDGFRPLLPSEKKPKGWLR